MLVPSYRYDSPSTPLAPLTFADEKEHRRRLAETANQAVRGKLNAQIDLTLEANADQTIVEDPRITPYSFIGMMPTTANAAAEIANGTLYISSRGDRTATVEHANTADTDRTYRVLIIG